MFQQYSPNMLKTYEACPKKFYYKYMKNISMPVHEEIYELGKNIHALASYYLRNENIIKMEAALSERESLIWEYLKSLKYFSYEVINTEYNLAVKIENYFLGGRLDALVKNNENYYILDYKTGSIPKNPKYDFQTMIYLLAVKEFFQTNHVTFVYLDLKHKDETAITLTPQLENEYKEKLINTINKINTGGDLPKKQNCKCEYSLICY